MNLDEVAPEQYDFITGRNPSFSALLEEKKYNRHMYLKILEPSYGPLIAEYLNYYYQGYDDAFHCIALQDILICFYYYSKDKTSTPSLTKKIIRKDIKTILKKISIAETK